MFRLNFKKIVIIFCLIITSLILCSCNNNVESDGSKKNITDKITTEKNKSEIDLSNCYFYDVKVLANGNYVKFYISKGEDPLLKYMEIIDAENDKVKSVIDISKYYMKNVNLKSLNNGFYIYGTEIGVFDYSGTLIKDINYPEDIEQNIYGYVFALSNDFNKMIYCSLTENKQEDSLDVKLMDLETKECKVIQNLNEVTLDKPCFYREFSFSENDRYVMYLGKKYKTINNDKMCYGSIDLNTFKISSEFTDKSNCIFYGNCEIIYDANVDYGKNSSGKIVYYNPSDNVLNLYSLENLNESQHIGLTNEKNMFISALCNWSNNSIEIKLYEDGNVIRKVNIECKDEEKFNQINVDDICYSSKSNKVYYSSTVWNGDEYMGNEYLELEMK